MRVAYEVDRMSFMVPLRARTGLYGKSKVS